MMFIFCSDTNRDAHYHWNRKCRRLPAGFQCSPKWMMSNLAPTDRAECPICRALEFSTGLEQSARVVRKPVPAGAVPVRRKRSTG